MLEENHSKIGIITADCGVH